MEIINVTRRVLQTGDPREIDPKPTGKPDVGDLHLLVWRKKNHQWGAGTRYRGRG